MLEDILLLSGNDIPFFAAKINIHQPTIKEIAYIGEENFFLGIQILNFSKEMMREEDRLSLADIDDFDILMSIINDENASVQRVQVTMLLLLLFPEYEIEIKPDGFYLIKENENSFIGKDNYSEFKDIIKRMFNMQSKEDEDYKPANEAARRIAEKLKKGREKVAELKGGNKKVSILSRYASILAIGLKKDLNSLFNYTVYQLNDVFKRYQLYQTFDINLRARMAGATDLDEVENWMDDIHP